MLEGRWSIPTIWYEKQEQDGCLPNSILDKPVVGTKLASISQLSDNTP